MNPRCSPTPEDIKATVAKVDQSETAKESETSASTEDQS